MRLAATGGGLVAGGLAATYMQLRAMPASWRGDGGLWDVASHIGNVPGSAMVVGTAVLSIAAVRNRLFYEVPVKEACATAAVACVLGWAANVLVETPALLEMPVMQARYESLVADPYDEVYGDAASVLAAGLLAHTMRRRPEQLALGVAEIPRFTDSDPT